MDFLYNSVVVVLETLLRELAQLARALGLGPRGSGFESRVPDHQVGGHTRSRGYRIMVVLHPSKVEVGVRFPLSAPKENAAPQGGAFSFVFFLSKIEFFLSRTLRPLRYYLVTKVGIINNV